MTNKREKYLNKYPILNERILHLTPKVYGMLFYKKKRPFKMNFYNDFGINLFSYFNGQKTLKDIFREIYGNNWEEHKETLLGFVCTEMNKETILLKDTKQKNYILEPSGSRKFFVPIHISFEITSRCNFKCIYCYNEFENNRELSIDEFKKIINEWCDLGLHSIELTGGEPTLRDDFFEILDFLYTKVSNVGILTNGSNFTDEFIDKLKRYKKFINIGISLDTLNKEKFNKLTNTEEYFDKVMSGIRKISKAGFNVRIGSVITNENYKDAEKIAEFVRNEKIGLYSYSTVFSFGKGEEIAIKDQKQEEITKEKMEVMGALPNDFKDVIKTIPLGENNDQLFLNNCGVGHKNVTVSSSGNIRVCNFLPENEDYVIGNVLDNQLTDIFKNPKMTFFTNLEIPSISSCNPCKYLVYCANCVVKPFNVMKNEEAICKWGKKHNVKKNLSFCKEFPNVKGGVFR